MQDFLLVVESVVAMESVGQGAGLVVPTVTVLAAVLAGELLVFVAPVVVVSVILVVPFVVDGVVAVGETAPVVTVSAWL